jgi:surface-anchored protein
MSEEWNIMKRKHPHGKAFFVLCLLMLGPPAWGQGHCARVWTDVTVYFAVETGAPDPNHPITLDTYHTDFEVSFGTTGWDVVVSYDGPTAGAGGLDIPPQDALLYANTNSRWVLPSIPAGFAFIGAQPGQPFWILPQNAGTSVLPLGLAAERADTGRLCRWNPHDERGADTPDLWFEVALLDIRGPADANFALWQADGIRPPVVFMSTHEGGITDDDVVYISAGSHVHLNWGFTEPGLHAVDFRISTVVRCDDWLTADWAPPGDGIYYGDGRIDFRDFAWMAAYWGETPLVDDPNTFMFVDPNDPARLVGPDALTTLADQWLLCGYQGCEENEDPNVAG